MKKQNLAIQLQQLENNKNFYYNIIMKNKEKQNIIKRIIQLEQIIQKKQGLGQPFEKELLQIEKIAKMLTLKELFELDTILMKQLTK